MSELLRTCGVLFCRSHRLVMCCCQMMPCACCAMGICIQQMQLGRSSACQPVLSLSFPLFISRPTTEQAEQAGQLSEGTAAQHKQQHRKGRHSSATGRQQSMARCWLRRQTCRQASRPTASRALVLAIPLARLTDSSSYMRTLPSCDNSI